MVEDVEEGAGMRKPPILKAFLSPVRRGRIPAVSLARAVVYSTSSSVIITTEIIFSLDLETLRVVLFFFFSFLICEERFE